MQLNSGRSNVTRLSAAVTGLLAAALAIASSAAEAAQADAFPTRPVRVIVPFTPGSGTDIVGRAVAQSLTESWQQSIVVDNRPGAGGTIVGELVAKANPDGYTLMLGNVSTLAIARSLYPRLPYDPLRDFAPITQLVSAGTALVATPRFPPQTFRDFVAAEIGRASCRERV